MLILNILAPVLVLVILGYIINQIGFMGPSFFKNCAKFTYWIALPVLLFDKISSTKFGLMESWKISVAMIASSFAIALIAWLLSILMKLEHSLKKTFIQTSFHCNTAFVGLPVIMYAVNGGLCNPKLIDAASMALGPMIPIINMTSVLIMGDKEGTDETNVYKLN